MSAWEKLGVYLHETQLLGSIHRTLYWDQNTSMPQNGSEWRAEQLSLLAKYLHIRQTSNEFEALLQEARFEFETLLKEKNYSVETFQRERNLKLLEEDFNRQKKLDTELVVHLATAQSNGYSLWKEAKASSNFQSFAPALKELINLRKQQASQLSESRSFWETLAQPFEPDLTISRLQELFLPLRSRLPELIEKAKSFSKSIYKKWDLSEEKQLELSNLLLKVWKFDPANSQLSQSPHPFSITLGPNDFRLTTRVVQGEPISCLLATAHEWGHSLYEQGLPSQTHQCFAWPTGQATSMSVHESQSLFWENRVVRSLDFAERFWINFANAGAPIKSGFELWREMNPFKPGLNRVEADELTYGLHILIRTDLEIDLIENDLDVNELPLEWNHRYKELLGIEPKNDAEGCLQDVHWSEGQFGYFPSYLLGHLISAQLSRAMEKSLFQNGIKGDDPIGECIRQGNEFLLLDWLRKEVHHYGRQLNAEDLVKNVTGDSLSSKDFLNHLEVKLEIMNVSI